MEENNQERSNDQYNRSDNNNGNKKSLKNQGRGDDEFPGYPHYPASEDILNPANGSKKVNQDPDEINRRHPSSSTGNRNQDETPLRKSMDNDTDDDELLIVPGTEADVTKEDLLILGPRDGDMDMGDDELIRGKMQPVNQADTELDIPGAELDDENEDIGAEDEENNYYSLGGDRHEGLEEDNQQQA